LTFLSIHFRIFRHNFTVKFPVIFPASLAWGRKDYYHLGSWAYTDMTDLLGRPKVINQLAANGISVNKQEYKYFGLKDAVPVYSSTLNQNQASGINFSSSIPMKPGRLDQSWSEAYYTKETDFNCFGTILGAVTTRHFSYTNMKYTYVPTVLQKIVTTGAEGIKDSTVYSGFDYLTGEPIEVTNYDSYGNAKISRTVPAYWRYPGMLVKNMLGQEAEQYEYLNDANTDATKNLLSASVTQWGVGGTTGARVDYTYVPGLYISNVADASNTRTYTYALANPSTLLTAMQGANIYRPVRNYVYKIDIPDNTTGVFSIPAGAVGTFPTGNSFDVSASAQSDPNWRLVSENTKYHHTGDVAEVRDILGKYASSYMGYNFSHNIASVSNAMFYSSVHEGAENTYLIGTTPTSDNTSVVLGNAAVVGKNCQKFVTKTLHFADMVATPPVQLLMYSVSQGIPTNSTVPELCKLDIQFANGVKRRYSVYLDAQKNVRMTSTRGESFTGFYVFNPQNVNMKVNSSVVDQFSLVFDPNYVKAVGNVVLATTYTANMTYLVKTAAQTACNVPDKVYNLPNSDCNAEVHTGEYCFVLPPSGTGTTFTVDNTLVPGAEINRNYVAMVWVHKSSPTQTTLTATQNFTTGSPVSYSVSMANASTMVQAGNWVLLKTPVIPASSICKSIVVSMGNTSTSGLAYYDDFRVQPATANMEASVFDHVHDRLMAKLNKDNIATFYDYDDRDRLVKVRSEVENLGPVTVKKYLYNDQKNQ
jgi:hypothetical protein